MNFHAWDWLLAALGALLVGVSKTGITGLSLLFVTIFATIMPARRSTGVVLPLLILGDIIAFHSYRRHTQWRHVWRLFPWAAVGVIGGSLALGRMDDHTSRLAIGGIVVGLALLHVARRIGVGRPEEEIRAPWFPPLVGILAGFTTIVSNAAGPLMVIYLLAMRLPKMEYMGTAAAFFLILNLFKLPFMYALGLITTESLRLNLILAPAVIAGTLLGRWVLVRIDQRLFENIALGLTLAAGAKMSFDKLRLAMARMTSRQMWAAKLEGRPVPRRLPAHSGEGGLPASLLKKAFIGLILGVDPSLRGTGLALVDFQPGRTPALLRCMTVRVPSRQPMSVALAEIHRAVEGFLADSTGVRHVALEQTIYVQNFQTAQILGAARGAAIAAAALRGLPVFEYSPLRVKQAVAGSGRASKEQLSRTVKSLLGHTRTLGFDESDAAGVALCHGFTWQP